MQEEIETYVDEAWIKRPGFFALIFTISPPSAPLLSLLYGPMYAGTFARL